MYSYIGIDKNSYEVGFAKLEQLQALLSFMGNGGFESFTRMNKPLQKNLIELTSELALDARCALKDIERR